MIRNSKTPFWTNAKSFRFMASLVFVALITVSVPQPVHAQGYLTLSSFSGNPGVTLQVSGGGYTPGENIYLYLQSTGTPSVANTVADNIGQFSNTAVSIPLSSGQGNIGVIAVGQQSRLSFSNSYYVQPFSPTISVTGSSNTPGSTLKVSGSGFAPNENVTLMLANGSASTIADSMGAFNNADLVIPNVSAQTYIVQGIGNASGAVAVQYFYVGAYIPNAYPSTFYVLPGQAITFSGSGFGSNETVRVLDRFSAQLTSFTTNSSGSFSQAGSYAMPYTASNTMQFFFVGASSNAQTNVTVTVGNLYPYITPSQYFILPGNTMTVSGAGFAPNEVVSLSIGSGVAVMANADAQGVFSPTTLLVPFGNTGLVSLNAVGQGSKVSTSSVITLGQFYPGIYADNYYVTPGSTITFTGSGFAPNESVSITTPGSSVPSVQVDQLGAFTTTVTAPFGATSKTFTFTGGSSGAVSDVTIGLASFYPGIAADNYYTQPGRTVNISGSGFAPNETVNITAGSFNATTNADNTGAIGSVAVTLPFGNTTSLTVNAQGALSQAIASTTITIAPFYLDVQPSSYYLAGGSNISFTGSGFAPNESVSVSDSTGSLGSVTADSNGNITTGNFTVPFSSTSTSYTFTGSSSGASQAVTVGIAALYPGLQLNNYYAVGGSAVILTGSGFAPNEIVNIKFGSPSLGSVSADSNGDFSYNTTVPYDVAGDKQVTATGQTSGAVGSTTFTQAPVYVGVQLGEYANKPGSSITFIGSGYLPSEPVEIMTDRTGTQVVHTFTADASGNFSNSGYITPTDFLEGNLVITVKGSHSLTPQTITYYVTGS